MRIGRIQNNYSSEGFDLVKEQKLSFAEICCNSREEAEKLILSKTDVLAEALRTGIDVSAVGRWNHTVQKDGKIDLFEKEIYIRLLDTAKELGAKTFVCGINYDKSISLYRNYVNAIDFLGELVEHANGRIKVAVQNCDWNNFVVGPEQWKVVLGELDGLYIKYDASHAYNRGQDYIAQLSDWGERIAHVHIKGTTHAGTRPVDDPPAGMDDIAWGPLFSILYARGYDGDLSIEPHSSTWHGELGNAGVVFTRDFISKYVFK